MLCQECYKKNGCRSLCPGAEKWADQDCVKQAEHVPNKVLPDLDYGSCFGWKDFSKSSPKGLKWIILQLHKEGKSTREIAYHLPCSQPYIVKVIQGDNQKTT